MDYYKILFDKEHALPCPFSFSGVSSCITYEENAALTQCPTLLDIKGVVKCMENDKSLKPYGFSAGLYKKFWHIIREDLTLDIQKLFSTGIFHPYVPQQK